MPKYFWSDGFSYLFTHYSWEGETNLQILWFWDVSKNSGICKMKLLIWLYSPGQRKARVNTLVVVWPRRLSCALGESESPKMLIRISMGVPTLTLVWPQSNSHEYALNSRPLALSFGLKLCCPLIDSRALLKSLNSRSLSFSSGLKLSSTLMHSPALSSTHFHRLSCALKEFKLPSAVVLHGRGLKQLTLSVYAPRNVQCHWKVRGIRNVR